MLVTKLSLQKNSFPLHQRYVCVLTADFVPFTNATDVFIFINMYNMTVIVVWPMVSDVEQ